MNTVSEKELSALKDLLAEEELLVKKFQMLADHTDDKEIKNQLTGIASKHQGHFNSLYSQLG